MPLTKSAKKKLKQDRKKEIKNKILMTLFKKTFKKTVKSPTLENVSGLTSLVDKLAKKRLIHKNKAARIKSKLSKIVKPASKIRKIPKKKSN